MIMLDIGLVALSWYLYRKTKQCSFTKLLNKAQFNKDIKRLRRNSDTIILIDIDKFKRINDIYGHKYGDQVIEDVAAQIRKSIRFSDKAYRIGGDEFAIITSNASVGDRIKQKLSNISISVGWGKTYEEADKNMYKCKNSVKKD